MTASYNDVATERFAGVMDEINYEIGKESPVSAPSMPAAPTAPDAPMPRLDDVIGVDGDAGLAKIGRLYSWSGRGAGRLDRAAIVEAIEAAGLTDAVDAPAAKSVKKMAGKAARSLAGFGYVVRSVKGLSKLEGDARKYRARWEVVRSGRTVYETDPVTGEAVERFVQTGGKVGDSYGRIVLTITQEHDDRITYEGDSELADVHRARFAEEMAYDPTEVGTWIRSVVTTVYNGVEFGTFGYFLRTRQSEEFGPLWETLTAAWGAAVAFLDVASFLSVGANIASGLAKEVTAIIASIDAQRKVAFEAGKDDIGSRAATSALTQLEEIAFKCKSYADLLGEENIADVRRAARELIATLEPLASDTAQRGALIWDEITWGV